MDKLLNKEGSFSKEDIIQLLQSEGDDKTRLFERSARVKSQYVGRKVYFRGLVEFSNICTKNCYYCGIRRANQKAE
ncbi:MAG: [FeFe] hydrogenase H-cluster radical SAM maturase HydE, partial [Bacteroidales bacterium]